MKRSNIPDELKRFADPGPLAEEGGDQPADGSPATGTEEGTSAGEEA